MQDPVIVIQDVALHRPQGRPMKKRHPSNARPNGQADASGAHRYAHYLVRPIRRAVPALFAVGVLAALVHGWMKRDEGHLTAASGIGYWFGIIGGMMMLFMLIYPLRKRVKALHWIGSVPSWFCIHMVFGVLGPTLVLYHANFRMGSINSSVSLAAMLLVVVSGIVGRYLYTKVHHGLYGDATNVREILGDTEALKKALGEELPNTEQLLIELRAFETRAMMPRRSLLSSVWAFVWLGVIIRRDRSRVLRRASRLVEQEGKRAGWTWREKRARSKNVRDRLTVYFAAIRKAARFAVFERLLALWHVLHLPLFILLVVTAVIHIIGVHQY